ncbi:MAG: HTTM domain-containing protein [Acidobacteria bacterium]|nr:HTTM domain-containing protein [Acidobacteriota bacterium]
MTSADITHPGLLDRAVNAVGDLRAISVMRVLIGAVVIRHLWPALRAEDTAVERFHVLWWSWLPEPSPSTYRFLVWIGVAAGAAMILGVAARAATAVALATVSYLLFVDMTGFAHNRGYLVWILLGLTLSPPGPRLGAAHLRERRNNLAMASTGVIWPVLLLRIVASSVYLTSALTKLADPDWSGGLVLWDRVVRFQHEIPFDGWVQDVLTSRAFYRFMSPSAIFVELFIGLGVWFPRTRLSAIWVAIVFHSSIEVMASVQTFSYTAIAALLIWVTPSERDRQVLNCSPTLARLIRYLDWLHRFSVHSVAATQSEGVGQSDAILLIDRDGTRREGADAELTVLSRLPLLFPFAAPLLAMHRCRSGDPKDRCLERT